MNPFAAHRVLIGFDPQDQKGEKDHEEDAQLVASFMVCSSAHL